MPNQPLILTIAAASAENPRNSEAAMIERADGSLLLAWQEFLGSEIGSEDYAPGQIAAMDSADGGRTWTGRRVLVPMQPGDVNVYSPNFLRLPDGELLLFFFRYNQLGAGQEQLGSAYLCRSRDDGRTFSEPAEMWSRQPITFASSVVKRLSTGRIVLPLGLSLGAIWSETDHHVAGAAWSDDGGQTWCWPDVRADIAHRGGREQWDPEPWVNLPLRGAMEAHVEELRDGRLLMVMRTQLGAVFSSHSADGGETWSLPQTTGLRAPESCPDLVRLPGTGDLLLVWNNAPYNPTFQWHFGQRTPLTVAVSRDEGLTWGQPRDVETDPGWAYSNPGCTFTRGGEILLHYWAVPHTPEGQMSGLIDLKLAILEEGWVYGS